MSVLWHLCACVRAQSCPVLCSSMDRNRPDSSVHGISQARTLEWVATSSPEDLLNTGISSASPVLPALAGGSFASEPPGKPTQPQLCPCYSWNKPHVLFPLKSSCFRILSPQISVWLFHLVWDFTQKSFTFPPSLLLISIQHWTCTYLSHILSASPART